MSPPKETGLENPPGRTGFFQEISIEFLIHELKDPIAIIETGLRTVLEKQDKYGTLTPKQANTLMRSLRNTRKAWGILNDLLEIGRSEAGCLVCSRFSPLKAVQQSLKDALETVTGPAAEEIGKYQKEAELLKLFTQHGVAVCASPRAAGAENIHDDTKIRQITRNLYNNALHHRPQPEQPQLDIDGGWLAVDVKDDGPGIEPDHHELIFKRYTQVKECMPSERRGHGLGLAGALILARSIGGDIRVESRKGQGATFRLMLPVHLKSA